MATRTAAERRQADKEAYDAFLAGCPTRQVLDTIADKWRLAGVVEESRHPAWSAPGPRRHSELRRVVAGVSNPTLALEPGQVLVRVRAAEVCTAARSSACRAVSPLTASVAAVRSGSDRPGHRGQRCGRRLRLERDGLVTRTITASVPVRVDYELTDLGRDLLPLLRSLKQWSEANIEHIQRHRETFDAALEPAAS